MSEITKATEKEFTEKSLVMLLILVAVILALVIFANDGSGTKIIKEKQTSTLNNLSGVMGDLTDEQKVLYYNPEDGASPESSQAFLNLVNKLAIAKDELVITDCVSQPTVFKVNAGSLFVVNNKGKTDINFGILDERVMVRAGERKEILANYKNGVGIYGYGCDNPNLNRSVGILVITP